jgi:hypothetical protein
MNRDHLSRRDCSESHSVTGDGVTVIFSKLFDPAWHPYHGQKLSVFPRFLILHGGVHDRRQATSVSCWPDLATLIEDEAARQLVYYPAEASCCSLRLLFDKTSQRSEVFVYRDDELWMHESLSLGSATETSAPALL